MNTKRIKELAEQAGLKVNADGEISPAYFGSVDSGYRKFAALVAAEEREACAKVCSDALRWAIQQEREECLKICLDYNKFYWMATHGGLKCAELIKERNNECMTAPLTKTRRSGEFSRLGQNRKNG